MFGKKKRVLEEVEPVTRVSETPIVFEGKPSPPMPSEPPKFEEQEQQQRQLTEEEKALIQLIRDYKKYVGVFTPTDMANMPGVMRSAEKLNLLFGIFSEIRGVRQDLDFIAHQLGTNKKGK